MFSTRWKNNFRPFLLWVGVRPVPRVVARGGGGRLGAAELPAASPCRTMCL